MVVVEVEEAVVVVVVVAVLEAVVVLSEDLQSYAQHSCFRLDLCGMIKFQGHVATCATSKTRRAGDWEGGGAA